MNPFITCVHTHPNDQRTLVSTRWQSHPDLAPLFPNNVPESYALKRMREGWTAGAHRHRAKNEVFECTIGAILVNLRWVDAEGVSRHASVRLSQELDTLLVIPAGVWHEVITELSGSRLDVHSSTLFQDAPHTDEVRALPEGYDAHNSVEFTVIQAATNH